MTTAMKDVRTLVDNFRARLPAHLHERVDALAEGVARPGDSLHLIVLGGFSVGKSTLLNMLIGEQYLHVAKEEATSLPTFIEYGDVPAMMLVGTDGSALPLNASAFRDATSNAPAGAACATLALPLTWLQGVTVVDLPGLGTVSVAREQYTAAQILQADAVLYLLDPRGPSQADIAALRTVAQYGKRIKVMVTRWDDIIAAQQRGEPAPRLDAWADQIETQAGLRVRLAGASREGVGREELLDFVARAGADLDQIRQRRFVAELRPLLENALGENALAQRACSADSEQAVQALHVDLMQRKQDLLALKSELYERQQGDQAAALRNADQAVSDSRRPLADQLQQLVMTVADDASWGRFEADANVHMRQAISALAAALSTQSGRYGELTLPEARVERLNVRVPPLAVVDTATFVETAKLAALEHAMLEQQSKLAATERQLATLPDVALAEAEAGLNDKLRMQEELASQPLEYIVEVVPGNGAAEVGRIVGELADIGLMFVNPATAASKAGSVIGKGAKLAKMTVDAKKVASAIKTGVRTVQAIKGGKVDKVMPPPVRDKLAMLEALSLGYWGERIGSMLGGAPQERLVVDPQARAQQQQALALLDQDIQQARRELAHTQDMFNERQLTGWALEQGKRELARLEQDVAELSRKRAQREQQAQVEAKEAREQALHGLAERAAQALLASYDGQGATMTALLSAHVAAYWETEVDAVVAERVAVIDALAARMRDAADVRAATLATLRNEAQALDDCIQATW